VGPKGHAVVYRHRVPKCAMTEEFPKGKRTELALAIAEGRSVASWARANQVPKRTAYRWAADPKVRSAVESVRRRAVDRAIGRLAKRATWATDEIAVLAKAAESESVRLRALRAMLSDMMGISQFGTLEGRMALIEEQLRARTRNANRPR
jgi:hypothetical protein